MIDEAKRIIFDLRYTNDTYNDDQIADMLERLCSELEKYKDLAERRLQRKNMYKERSEKDFAEKIQYRLELDKMKCERDAAISDLHGDCDVCKNYDECVKHSLHCINSGMWEWRGIPKKFI